MRKLLLTCAVFCTAWAVNAQDVGTDSAGTGPLRLLVIPFEDKMFFSDVMEEMVQGSDLNPEDLVNILRNGIQLSIRTTLSDSMEVGTFLRSDSIPSAGLISIYEQLGYRYLPVRPNPKGLEVKRSNIERGQVKTSRDTTSRYMSAELKDATVLESFHRSHGFNHFLFITQLEVRMDLSDPQLSVVQGNRTVEAHYTLADVKGNTIFGGLASHRFDGGAAQVQRWMSKAFGPIAKHILQTSFPKSKKDDGRE